MIEKLKAEDSWSFIPSRCSPSLIIKAFMNARFSLVFFLLSQRKRVIKIIKKNIMPMGGVARFLRKLSDFWNAYCIDLSRKVFL